MEYQARFERIDARAATIEGNGDKVYLLFDAGRPCAVIDSAAFEALYIPKAIAPDPPLLAPPEASEIPPAKRKYTRAPEKQQRKPKATHPWKKSNAPAVQAAESGPTTKDRILAALRKKPHSPLELAHALACPNDMQKIYVATSLMKSQGLIERFTAEEGDGLPRWQLTESAKGATA